MLNAIWLFLALTAIVVGVGVLGDPKAVADAIFASAQSAVQLVIGLIGVMVFFLGPDAHRLRRGSARRHRAGLTPITRRLFPEIPADHPR